MNYASVHSPISTDLTAAERGLVRKMDSRIIPLSAGIYLLCYLDRSNVGNARTLNASAHHDLLSETDMSDYQYVISLMIFLVAYGLFEAPSNSKSLLPELEILLFLMRII